MCVYTVVYTCIPIHGNCRQQRILLNLDTEGAYKKNSRAFNLAYKWCYSYIEYRYTEECGSGCRASLLVKSYRLVQALSLFEFSFLLCEMILRDVMFLEAKFLQDYSINKSVEFNKGMCVLYRYCLKHCFDCIWLLWTHSLLARLCYICNLKYSILQSYFANET